MDQDDRHHEVRAPAVQSSNEPTERDLVIQSLQAVPSFSSGRHINKREHDAGHDLQHEHHERRAAENIKPAGGFARYRMLGGFLDDGANLQTLIQPLTDGFNQTHGRISRTILEAWPGVGISPALIMSFPPSTL